MISHDDCITIQTLLSKGTSIRDTAKAVRHSTWTVRKYARLNLSEIRFRQQRTSCLDPYKGEVERLLIGSRKWGKQCHNLKTAYKGLLCSHPDISIQYSAFCDFVRNRCDMEIAPMHLARIPLEHVPGDAQIDFCCTVYYRNGKRVNGHQFTMSFPYSNVVLVQLYPSENQQCLEHAMSNCFEAIGFVPNHIRFDNASSAIISFKQGNKREVNPEYAKFAAWYGFDYEFCNPRSGWEKGNVERNNDVARKNYFSPPPHIGDEQSFNPKMLKRCIDDAAHSEHYLKHVSKLSLFEEDRASCHPLSKSRYDERQTDVRKTDKCALISVRSCRYSVSERHAYKNVIIKLGAFSLDIYDEYGKFICRHKRSYKAGSTTIDATMYKEVLAARQKAQIRKSDNEYVDGHERVLSEMQKAVNSVRPAMRDDAFTEFCEKHDIEIVHSPDRRAMLLYDLQAYNVDKEVYDKNIESNSGMVQKASLGRTICRCRPKQQKQGT